MRWAAVGKLVADDVAVVVDSVCLVERKIIHPCRRVQVGQITLVVVESVRTSVGRIGRADDLASLVDGDGGAVYGGSPQFTYTEVHHEPVTPHDGVVDVAVERGSDDLTFLIDSERSRRDAVRVGQGVDDAVIPHERLSHSVVIEYSYDLSGIVDAKPDGQVL